jgi:preprotein translocase subunit SecG
MPNFGGKLTFLQKFVLPYFPRKGLPSTRRSFSGSNLGYRVTSTIWGLRQRRLSHNLGKEVFFMKRFVLFLVMVFLAAILVVGCGKQEEPAKAQKPAAEKKAVAEKAAAEKAAAEKAEAAKAAVEKAAEKMK